MIPSAPTYATPLMSLRKPEVSIAPLTDVIAPQTEPYPVGHPVGAQKEGKVRARGLEKRSVPLEILGLTLIRSL